MKDFPARALALRKERGWRQDDLAEKAGVSQTNVSNMEGERSLKGVRLVTAVRVAKAFGLTLDELVLGIPDPWARLAKLVEVGKLTPGDAAPTEPETAPAAGNDGSAPKRPKKRSRRRS